MPVYDVENAGQISKCTMFVMVRAVKIEALDPLME